MDYISRSLLLIMQLGELEGEEYISSKKKKKEKAWHVVKEIKWSVWKVEHKHKLIKWNTKPNTHQPQHENHLHKIVYVAFTLLKQLWPTEAWKWDPLRCLTVGPLQPVNCKVGPLWIEGSNLGIFPVFKLLFCSFVMYLHVSAMGGCWSRHGMSKRFASVLPAAHSSLVWWWILLTSLVDSFNVMSDQPVWSVIGGLQ